MAVTLKIELSQGSQSRVNNTSKVRAKVYATSTLGSFNNDACPGWLKLDGKKYTFSHNFSANTTTLLYDTTRTISHNSDGSKTVYANASFATDVSSGTITASSSLPLTKINRRSQLNAIPSFNLEVGTSISITKYVSSYTDTLRIYLNDTLIKTISDIKNGDTLIFTTEELNTIYNLTSNSKSAIMKATLTTYNGSSSVGSTSVNTTGIIQNANPTILEITTNDSNEITTLLTGNNQKYIEGYSTLHCHIKALSQKGALIDHFVIDGNIFPASYDETNDFYYGEAYLTNVSKSTIEVFAVDSRANNSSELISPNYIGYFEVQKGLQTEDRIDSVEEKVNISFEGTYWNGNFNENKANILRASYKFKKTKDDIWFEGTTSINLIIDNNKFSFTGPIKGDTDEGFDINHSYDIVVLVSDELSDKEYKMRIDAGNPAIAIYGNKVSLGNKYDEELGGTQIYGDTYLNRKKIIEPNIVQITLTEDVGDFSTNYSYFHPFFITTDTNEVITVGDKLTYFKQNLIYGDRTIKSPVYGVQVGKGVSFVRVKPNIRYLNNLDSSTSVSTIIVRRRDEVESHIAGASETIIASGRHTSTPEYIVPVQEGDLLYALSFKATKTADIEIISTNGNTNIKFEVVS